MIQTGDVTDQALLGSEPGAETVTVARNVSTRYAVIAVEALLGVMVLPFNVSHLGRSAYGLWMLTASITTYFSVLDLGYSGALVKYVAHYRARRDVRALNEVLSTTFYVFTTFSAVTYLVAIVLAYYLDRLFQLTPDQIHVGRIVLLIISLNVAAGTMFSVFGGVINGFQRYDLNNVVGAISSIVTAGVNVAVLAMGYGLIELVAATTSVRLVTYVVYRANAYRVFPGLKLSTSAFRRDRLRELTFFSVYMLLIDCANKLNYTVDAVVIGVFLNTSAVAVWTVGQRLAEMTQRLTNQLNDVLFPTVVDNDTAERGHRLKAIFIQGTRLSLATVVPLGGALMLLAPHVIHAWVGPDFATSAVVLQLLALVVIIRVGNATASTVLKGAGKHRLVALANTAGSLVNIALSIALVRPLGLAGVALGTLVPVAVTSMLVLFPAGCRRVGVSVPAAFGAAVWPALWPAGVMTAYVFVTASLVPDSLVAVAAEMVIAMLVYAITFVFFSLSRHERGVYVAKGTELVAAFRVATVSEGA